MGFIAYYLGSIFAYTLQNLFDITAHVLLGLFDVVLPALHSVEDALFHFAQAIQGGHNVVVSSIGFDSALVLSAALAVAIMWTFESRRRGH